MCICLVVIWHVKKCCALHRLEVWSQTLLISQRLLTHITQTQAIRQIAFKQLKFPGPSMFQVNGLIAIATQPKAKRAAGFWLHLPHRPPVQNPIVCTVVLSVYFPPRAGRDIIFHNILRWALDCLGQSIMLWQRDITSAVSVQWSERTGLDLKYQGVFHPQSWQVLLQQSNFS